MTNDIKLICIDLDGTLLMDDHATVSPGNLAALRAAAARGILVAPATGRIRPRLPAAVTQLPGVRYALLANGAQVAELGVERLLHENVLSLSTTLTLLHLLWENDLLPEVYQGDRMLIQRKDLERLLDDPIERVHTQYLMQMERPIEDLEAHLRANPDGIAKINVPYIMPEEKRKHMRELFEGLGIADLTSSMEHNLELNAPGANKGSGAAALCAHLGLLPQNVMALGDGDNDLELLRFAGYSVAMGNAEGKLKAAAKLVTDSNENDGVAKAIWKMLG